MQRVDAVLRGSDECTKAQGAMISKADGKATPEGLAEVRAFKAIVHTIPNLWDQVSKSTTCDDVGKGFWKEASSKPGAMMIQGREIGKYTPSLQPNFN